MNVMRLDVHREKWLGKFGEKEGEKNRKKSHMRISCIHGESPCEQILTKFVMSRDMSEIIVCENFGVENIKG